MKVLVLGNGAREHALVRALHADADVSSIVCAPGNAGIAELAELVPVDVADADAVADLAVAQRADLVVVGPEVPLVAGAADAVRARGIDCFGPSAAAARLEGSKAFAKEVMAAAGVPTARSSVCTTKEEALAALDAFGPPYVVKDDGLAAGKGVVVTDDRDAALTHATTCERVVIEEFLDGPEVSLFALVDGATVLPLEPAQDFKRVGDGDSGPNTGGMGAYSPLPWAPPDLVDDVRRSVLEPTVEEMAPPRHAVRRPALRRAGADLARRACHRVQRALRRPGDPGRAGPAAYAAGRPAARRGHRHGSARSRRCDWSAGAAVTVVLAAEGYPVAARRGRRVEGLAEAADVAGAARPARRHPARRGRPGHRRGWPGALRGGHRTRRTRGPRAGVRRAGAGAPDRRPPPRRHRRGDRRQPAAQRVKSPARRPEQGGRPTFGPGSSQSGSARDV